MSESENGFIPSVEIPIKAICFLNKKPIDYLEPNERGSWWLSQLVYLGLITTPEYYDVTRIIIIPTDNTSKPREVDVQPFRLTLGSVDHVQEVVALLPLQDIPFERHFVEVLERVSNGTPPSEQFRLL